MLNIPEELKNIYKNDQFPYADEVTPKDLIIYFPSLDLTIETDQIVDDSFELDESLCSESDFVFGACEASVIKFTVADVEQDLKGQWFTINQVIDGFDPVPLGKFKVDSCVKQDNLRFKDITAYNALKDTDVDVADWYIGLFPNGDETYTLKQFRELLLTYLGIDYVDETLPNDNMVVEKTIEPTQLSAREVLRCCVELQGGFGQANRYGKFYHKILQPAYGFYPAETLYPADNLYPVAENDTSYVHESIIKDTVCRYQEVRFEEYIVKEIDKLIIRTDEDDIGVIIGNGNNAYIIQGNFLVYGKSAAELEQIARNAFGNMAKRPYRPYEAECIGLPYIEVGDTLEFATDDTVIGYVLQRTLKGMQSLRDTFKADGSEQRGQNFSINTEIIQLKGKTTRIKKDVEGIRVEVENLETLTNTKFEQTDQKISAEAVRAISAENELNAKIELNAETITQEVNRARSAEESLNSKIEQTAEKITQEVSAKYTTKDEVIGLLPSDTLYPSNDLLPMRSVTSDLTSDYNSKFEQTATSISQEVKRATQAEGEISGRLDIFAGQIVLKVDANGKIAAVKLDADPSQGTSIKFTADYISLEGLVTANGNFKVLLDGSIETVNGKFSGTITGSVINGSVFVSVGAHDMTTIADGTIQTTHIAMLGSGYSDSTLFYPGGASFQSNNYTTNVSPSGITTPSANITTATINTAYIPEITGDGWVTKGKPIHTGNIGQQSVRYADLSDTARYANSADYASYAGTAYSLAYTLYTNQITASNTGYGNIDFLGFDNAAGVKWVQANFQPLTASDIRLKYDFKPMSEIPDEIFYSLKPYQFRYKTPNYGDGIFFGLIAQQVENAFKAHGLNPYDYDLIEVKDVRKYTDDGFYVNEKTHRIHYINLIAWLISIVQKQNDKIKSLESVINSLEN